MSSVHTSGTDLIYISTIFKPMRSMIMNEA